MNTMKHRVTYILIALATLVSMHCKRREAASPISLEERIDIRYVPDRGTQPIDTAILGLAQLRLITQQEAWDMHTFSRQQENPDAGGYNILRANWTYDELRLRATARWDLLRGRPFEVDIQHIRFDTSKTGSVFIRMTLRLKNLTRDTISSFQSSLMLCDGRGPIFQPSAHFQIHEDWPHQTWSSEVDDFLEVPCNPNASPSPCERFKSALLRKTVHWWDLSVHALRFKNGIGLETYGYDPEQTF